MTAEFTNQLQPGMKVGKYQIVSLIGAGGMAMLYKAYDKSLDRYVAVKQIAPNLAADEKFVERFRHEAQVLARVSQGQQNVVAVYELVEEAGGLFMIMEFIEGTSLQALMDRGAASLQTGLGILLKIALGLKAIHSQGLVHRDLKPDNVMVQQSGNVKIADFGLIGRAGGRTSLPMGTTQYMAPEMFTGGAVDGRADIYSLGFLAYQMFVGPEKFGEVFSDVLADPESANIRWMHWHSNPQIKAPPLREVQPGIPPLVARIVERMMEKDSARRFTSADQIIKWLRQIFVMYVQGQSLSEQDSARLEEQVDAEIEGASGRGAAGAAGRVPARQGAAEGQPVALKTAPLPKRRKSWLVFGLTITVPVLVAVIAAGTLVMGGVGWWVVDSIQSNSAKSRAESLIIEGKDLLDRREFAKAAGKFDEVGRDFAGQDDLRLQLQRAHFWYLVASVEQSLLERKWESANDVFDSVSKAARAFPTRKLQDDAGLVVSELRKRLSKKEQYYRMMLSAQQAEEAGDYQAAANYLNDILRDKIAENPDEIKRAVARVKGLQLQKEADEKIVQADALLRQRNYPLARKVYLEAQQIYDGDKVRAKLDVLNTIEDFNRRVDQAKKEVEAEAWADAVKLYREAIALADSLPPDVRRLLSPELIRSDLNKAEANAAFELAMALKAQGKFSEAKEKFQEVLDINPAHPKAGEELRFLEEMEKYSDLKDQLEKALREGNIDLALRILDAMIAKQIDPGERDRLVQQKRTLQSNHLFRKVNEAIRKKEYDEAKRVLQELEGVGADAQRIEGAHRRIDRESNYWTHFDKGMELLGQQRFIEAIKEFEEAARYMNDGRVQAAINDCKYQMFLWQGDQARKAGKDAEARGYYSLAQQKKDTPEVRERLKALQEGR